MFLPEPFPQTELQEAIKTTHWLLTLYVMHQSIKVRVKVSLRESSQRKALTITVRQTCECVCDSCPAEDFIPWLPASCHILMHSWMHSGNYNCESYSNVMRLKQTLRSCYKEELWMKKIFHIAMKVIFEAMTTYMTVYCPLNVWYGQAPLTLLVNHCHMPRCWSICLWHHLINQRSNWGNFSELLLI